MNGVTPRFSRHVSFQAVVPPAVGFPVYYNDYSGPSLVQTLSQVENLRQQPTEKAAPEEPPHGGRASSLKIKRALTLDGNHKRQKSASYILVSNDSIPNSASANSSGSHVGHPTTRILSVVKDGPDGQSAASDVSEAAVDKDNIQSEYLRKLRTLGRLNCGEFKLAQCITAQFVRCKTLILANKRVSGAVAAFAAFVLIASTIAIILCLFVKTADDSNAAQSKYNLPGPSGLNHGKHTDSCDTPLCLRIALSIQNMLLSFGQIDSPVGDQELCQEFVLRTFFQQIAKGNEDHENIFREPLKIATDLLLRNAYEANASVNDYNKLWRHSGQPLLQACIRSHLIHDYHYLVYDNNYAESTRLHGSRDNAVSVETPSTWRVFFENKTSERFLSVNTYNDNDSVQRPNEELPIDHDYGKHPSPIQQMLEDSLLSYNTFDEVLQNLQMRYRISLLFDTWIGDGQIRLSGPQEIEPWDELDLTNEQRTDINLLIALKNYVCFAFASAERTESLEKSPIANCSFTDPDRITNLLKILQRISEVRALERLQRTLLDSVSFTEISLERLMEIMGRTVDLTFYLRDLLRNLSANGTVAVLNIHSFVLIGETLRQVRTSDLQDYIIFSIMHTYGAAGNAKLGHARNHLYRIAYGLGNLDLPSMCLWEFPSPIWKAHLLEPQMRKLHLLQNMIDLDILPQLKEAFIEYVSLDVGSQALSRLISSLALMQPTEYSPKYDDLKIYFFQEPHGRRTSAIQLYLEYNQFLSRNYFAPGLCQLLRDFGLCTYGNNLVEYQVQRQLIVPSLLFILDQRIDFSGKAPRFVNFATIGYHLSLALTEAIFKSEGAFDGKRALIERFSAPLKRILKGQISKTELAFSNPHDSLEALQLAKTALALEMLARAYLKLGNFTDNVDSGLPGVHISDKATLFLFLLQTQCANLQPVGRLGEASPLTPRCQRVLKAATRSPTFMGLVGCKSQHLLAAGFSQDHKLPTASLTVPDCFFSG